MRPFLGLQVHGTLWQLKLLVIAASQVLEESPAWLVRLPVRLQAYEYLLLPGSSACPAVRAAFLDLVSMVSGALAASNKPMSSNLGPASSSNDSEYPPSRDGSGMEAVSRTASQEALQLLLSNVQSAVVKTLCPGRHDSIQEEAGTAAHDMEGGLHSHQALEGCQQPFQAVWLKKAAQAALTDPGSDGTLQHDFLSSLLQHPASEVRAAAAKSARQSAQTGKPNMLCHSRG